MKKTVINTLIVVIYIALLLTAVLNIFTQPAISFACLAMCVVISFKLVEDED